MQHCGDLQLLDSIVHFSIFQLIELFYFTVHVGVSMQLAYRQILHGQSYAANLLAGFGRQVFQKYFLQSLELKVEVRGV